MTHAPILVSDSNRSQLTWRDTAEILTRLFFVERSLIIGQAGWITRVPRLEDKAVNTKGSTPHMKRVGMTWQVDPEHWEEYKAIHLNPWPDLIEAIQKVGIHNYSIFAFGTRVFAYMEIDGDDPYEALDKLSKTAIKQKWDEEVTVWVLPEAVEGPGLQFLELDRIFYCS